MTLAYSVCSLVYACSAVIFMQQGKPPPPRAFMTREKACVRTGSWCFYLFRTSVHACNSHLPGDKCKVVLLPGNFPQFDELYMYASYKAPLASFFGCISSFPKLLVVVQYSDHRKCICNSTATMCIGTDFEVFAGCEALTLEACSRHEKAANVNERCCA